MDALTVCDDLRRAGQLEEAGGEAYVHSLPTVVPAVGAVMHYARIVHDHALLRSLLSTTRDIQGEVLAHRGEPRELIERAEAALFRIGHDGGSAEMRTIEAVLHEEIDKLEELSRKDVGLTGVPSGFARPRQPHRRLPARQPDRGGGPPVDGQEHPRHQHRRERGHRPRRAGGAVLARDVGDRAGPPLHRLAGEGLERRAAEGPRARRSLAQGAERGRRSSPARPIFLDDSSDIGVLEMRAKARRLHAAQRARPARRGLSPAGPRRHPLGQPRGAGRPDQPRTQDPRPRAGDPGDRRVAALARRREPQPADPDALRPARERPARAGRRPRDVRLPRGLLPQGRVRAHRARPT